MAKPYVTPVYSEEELATEEWRPIPSVPSYFASNLGRVSRIAPNGQRSVRIPTTNTRGYPKLNLPPHGGRRTRKVHHLVAEAFLGPQPDGLTVNHKDGDKFNSRASNLEYVTLHQNTAHYWSVVAPSHGWAKRVRERRLFDPRSCVTNAALTEDAVRWIRSELRAGRSQSAVSRDVGVSDTAIWCIANGKTWRWVTDEAA